MFKLIKFAFGKYGVLFSLVLFNSACSTFYKYEVDTNYLNEPLKTTVDSKIAQYYLQDYLKGKKHNPEFNIAIETFENQFQNVEPNRNDLKAISEQYSLDFSALIFAQSLMQQPKNISAQNEFSRLINEDKQKLLNYDPEYEKFRLIIVPAWDYVNSGKYTGADFALQRKILTQIGIEHIFLDVESNGSVEMTADFIVSALERYEDQSKQTIIVGASAANPAIHIALDRLNTENNQAVDAWINLGGILQGTPLIDYFSAWPQKLMLYSSLFFQDWEQGAIMSMSQQVRTKRYSELNLNQNITILNYVGLSLTGSLSEFAHGSYTLIKHYGPNDGLTLLSDAIAPNSVSVISLNSDHFFLEDPDIKIKTVAVVKTMLFLLDKKKAQTQ